jgi:6-phosphogluconolactonase (cycloisomerase 2 family)
MWKTMNFLLALFCVPLFFAPANAQSMKCNRQGLRSVLQVAVPGHPFSAIPSLDGCKIFVSLLGQNDPSHIAVLARRSGAVWLERDIAVKGQAAGMDLSHDGRFLVVANGIGVTLLDVARLLAGSDDAALGYFNDGELAGSVYVALSPDNHLMFVSDERANTLSVYDFAALRVGETHDMIGQIRTGIAPVGLAFSPDGRLLYSTSEILPGDDRTCPGEGGGSSHAAGGLLVIDVARAAIDPADAVLARVRAGCNVVRVALSPKGDVAYVSARGNDTLQVFDTGKLLSDGEHALSATLKVGKSPVGVAVGAGIIFVANSDRFGDGKTQSVSMIEAESPFAHQGRIPTGGFPRELRLTSDGGTLLITNFDTNTLELIDLARRQEFGNAANEH